MLIEENFINFADSSQDFVEWGVNKVLETRVKKKNNDMKRNFYLCKKATCICILIGLLVTAFISSYAQTTSRRHVHSTSRRYGHTVYGNYVYKNKKESRRKHATSSNSCMFIQKSSNHLGTPGLISRSQTPHGAYYKKRYIEKPKKRYNP